MRAEGLRLGRVEVTGGFLLAAALLFYLDRSGVLPWALLACVCHELGHWAAIRATGGRVARLRLSAVGAELQLSAAGHQSKGGRVLSALAGPGVNLALAFAASRLDGEGWRVFAGVNLALGCFNLLPVRQLDGGQALACLMGERGEGAAEIVSLASAVLLAAAGAAAFWATKSNFTLLLTAAWLLFSLCREKTQNI